jgi:hypothetical protein
MTEACATLDHAAKAIMLRCAEGLRVANSKQTPRRIETRRHGLVGRFDDDWQRIFVIRLQDTPYHDHRGVRRRSAFRLLALCADRAAPTCSRVIERDQVNEAYMRLVDYTRMQWQDRAHFFAVSAQ